MGQIIAEQIFKAVGPNGRKIEITVQLEAPIRSNMSKDEEWCCKVVVSPILDQKQDVFGISSLQALSIATDFIVEQLFIFQKHGGKLLVDDETEFENVQSWLTMQT